MFPYADAHATLDMTRQRIDEMVRDAAERRLARAAKSRRRRSFRRTSRS